MNWLTYALHSANLCVSIFVALSIYYMVCNKTVLIFVTFSK